MKMNEVNWINRFVVITGGPGSGKTSLIEALQRAGYARSVEAGRASFKIRWPSAGLHYRGAIASCLQNSCSHGRSGRMRSRSKSEVPYFSIAACPISWAIFGCATCRSLNMYGKRPTFFVITRAYSSPLRGRKSSDRIMNGSRISTKRCEPIRLWSPRITSADTNWSRFRVCRWRSVFNS